MPIWGGSNEARDRRPAARRLARHYPQVVSSDLPFRNPEDREPLLSGLRLAMDEAT
jgi:hypothetical protein